MSKNKFFQPLRSMARRIALMFSSRLCPVCQKKVFRWRPFTREVGDKVCRTEVGGRVCPHCASMERTRHFILWLQGEGIIRPGVRMLHFAPEPGVEARIRPILGSSLVTADLFMEGVDRKEDITDLTFEDGSFDFIYCSNVLEHVPEDRKAMAELFRVLTPGGLAYIQVPIHDGPTDEDPSVVDPVERTRRFGQADHVRWYGFDIEDRLKEAGFQVATLYMPDALNLEDSTIKSMNLGKREAVHLCTKAA